MNQRHVFELHIDGDGEGWIKGNVPELGGILEFLLDPLGADLLGDKGLSHGDPVVVNTVIELVEGEWAHYQGPHGIDAEALRTLVGRRPNGDPDQSRPSAARPADQKVISRWGPRMDDPSSDVRGEAYKAIAKLAVEKPYLRDELVPILLKRAEAEPSWSAVMNSMFFYGDLPEIPKADPEWLDAFLSTYIAMARRTDYMRNGGWSEIRELLEEGWLAVDHPQMREIEELASWTLSKAEDDVRSHLFAVLDWIEDNR